MIPLSQLFTRYSTWVVALLMGALARWLDLSDAEQAKYIAHTRSWPSWPRGPASCRS
jgi:hypothetical protein